MIRTIAETMLLDTHFWLLIRKTLNTQRFDFILGFFPQNASINSRNVCRLNRFGDGDDDISNRIPDLKMIGLQLQKKAEDSQITTTPPPCFLPLIFQQLSSN